MAVGLHRSTLRMVMWMVISVSCWTSREMERPPKARFPASKQVLEQSLFAEVRSDDGSWRNNSNGTQKGSVDDTEAFRKLADFLLDEMTESLHVIYDEALGDVTALVKVSEKLMLPIVVLKYNERNIEELLEGISKMAIKNVLVYCGSSNVLHLFSEVRKNVKESSRVSWFVLSQQDLAHDLQQILREGTQVALVTQITPIEFRFQSSRVDPDNLVRFHDVGVWNASGEITLSGEGVALVPDLHQLYSNMNGRKIVATANHNLPHFGIVDLDNGTSIVTGGVDATILESLSQAMNFTYEVVRPADGKWGGIQADGTVTGMIGMVARQEAQLALCQITITASRETVVDFAYSYWIEGYKIVSRAPAKKDRTLAILSPFRVKVWGGIILTLLLMGPITYGFLKYRIKGILHQKACPSVTTVAFNMYRSFLLQGNKLQVDDLPLRCLFVFWYFFSVICYGTMTAVLAVPSFERTMNTLEDFVDWGAKSGYGLRMLKDSSDVRLFQDATSGVYRKAWDHIVEQDPAKTFSPNPDATIELILEEKFVAIYPLVKAQTRTTELGKWKYHLSHDSFYMNHYGVACIQGSPYKTRITSITLRLTEAGLISKWTSDEVAMAGKGIKEEEIGGKRREGLTVSDMQANFYIWVIGQVTASVALLAEICISLCFPPKITFNWTTSG